MRILLMMMVFLPGFIFSQEINSRRTIASPTRNSVSYHVTLFSQSDGKLAPSGNNVIAFTEKLESKRHSLKTEKAFLHYLFAKTQQEFLSTFKPYASFADLVEHGSYNCLTATSLYSILLDHFNMSYQVLETNEHIFILCNTENGDVLLETTDAEHGFVDSAVGIAKRLAIYRRQNVQTSNPGKSYSYSGSIMDSVNMTGMLGLLHFNHAAKAYNQKDFPAAIAHLHHAFLLHRSARMEEFAGVLILTIQNTKMMDPRIKQDYIQKILALKRGRLGMINSTRS